MVLTNDNLKECCRCNRIVLLLDFDANRKGELYKTCRRCLTRDHKTKHEYYEANKEEINKHTKEWQSNNRERHLEQKKHYKQENKDYFCESCNCECGGCYSRQCKARHLKSKKHQDYLEKLNVNVLEI